MTTNHDAWTYARFGGFTYNNKDEIFGIFIFKNKVIFNNEDENVGGYTFKNDQNNPTSMNFMFLV